METKSKTFKVTFFDKMDIFEVKTFHNVPNADQLWFAEMLANLIRTQDLAPVVRCFSGDEDYTEAINHFIRYVLNVIEPDYAINWYNKL